MVEVRLARRLLGGHVGGRPERGPLLGQGVRVVAFLIVFARRAERLGHAEVRQHRGAVREQDVAGLDVAVNDAALVRVREPARHVLEDADRLGNRERALADPFAERRSLDEGHDEEREPLHLARGQDRHDVGMLEAGRDHHLPLKAGDIHPARETLGQHLDDDLAVERRIVGEEHMRHTAAAQFPLHGIVVTEGLVERAAKVGEHRGNVRCSGDPASRQTGYPGHRLGIRAMRPVRPATVSSSGPFPARRTTRQTPGTGTRRPR